ncbi:MAG: TPM domain-containing protein [bacterium]|nr:TPM domain-containing protein [bacterium]
MMALLTALLLTAIPPAPTQYVTDNAHALSSDTRSRLETQLEAFDQKTGDQVIVWIGETTGGEPLEQFTVDAAQEWRVGKKGKDNGAALFMFMRDHKVRIEVGYGLESVLTDARSSEIIRDTIVPHMKQGETDAAVEDGVDAMLATIDPAFVPPSHATTTADSSSDDTAAAIVTLLIVLLVFGGLIFAAIVTIRRRGKPKGDWMDAWMFGSAAEVAGRGSSSHWSGGGFGGGGFSGGGGGFGGGGASGGW